MPVNTYLEGHNIFQLLTELLRNISAASLITKVHNISRQHHHCTTPLAIFSVDLSFPRLHLEGEHMAPAIPL